MTCSHCGKNPHSTLADECPHCGAPEYGSAYESISAAFNNMRGRILGLIESWGLPERQERGAKATFKSLSYDAEKRVKEIATEKEDD